MLKQRGLSLIEVLAAIFVVSIGLLGVLAVIPFGAFQVSKARHAEYASNMLANAAEELAIREMANPTSWGITSLTSGGENVFSSPVTLNTMKFFWIEPREMTDPDENIFCIGSTFKPDTSDHPVNNWTEWMRGQDDLLYTSYSGKRPDFTGQGNRILSSGKYTWFFTYLPQATNEYIRYRIGEFISNDPDFKSEYERRVKEQPNFQSVINNFVNTRREYDDDTALDAALPGLQTAFQLALQDALDAVPDTSKQQIVSTFVASQPNFYEDLEEFLENTALREVPAWGLEPNVAADAVACYNRVPEADRFVLLDDPLRASRFVPSSSGGTFTPTAPAFAKEDVNQLLQTKYTFVTWLARKQKGGDVSITVPVNYTVTIKVFVSRAPEVGEDPDDKYWKEQEILLTAVADDSFSADIKVDLDLPDGAWCRILFVDKDNSTPKAVVLGNLPKTLYNGAGDVLTDMKGNPMFSNMQIYIPNGVLYRKQLADLPIR